jgi:hypothetical protein
MKIVRIKNMVWNSDKWKRTVEKLQNTCRLLVEELISAASNEEVRIAHMELNGQLKNPRSARGARMKSEVGATSHKQL